MKLILIVFFVLYLPLSGAPWKKHPPSAETDGFTYLVIALRGKVKNLSRNEWLKPSSRFDRDDVLSFDSPSAKMLTIDRAGRTYLCAAGKAPKGYLIQATKSPRNKRPGPPLNRFALEAYIGTDTIQVLGGALTIPINVRDFPLDSARFFYIRYSWRGETVNKQLPHDRDRIFIREDALSQVAGQPVDLRHATRHELYYYDADALVSTLIGPVKLAFLPEDILLPEVKRLLAELEPLTVEERQLAIEEFLFNYYGAVDQLNLRDWLQGRVEP